MNTPITPEALIELGFVNSNLDEYTYHIHGDEIQVYGYDLVVDISISGHERRTNATTIEDIKCLIRLFK